MSHPSTGREDTYPEDKVTHYPHKSPHKRVADFHANQMGHMMGLMRKHHNAKTSALKKKQK